MFPAWKRSWFESLLDGGATPPISTKKFTEWKIDYWKSLVEKL